MTKLGRSFPLSRWGLLFLRGLLIVLGIATWHSPAKAQPAQGVAKIGAFVTSLSDISEAQRKFEITFWVWLLSPDTTGAVDPAKTLEITNAASAERQYSVTTSTPKGRYSQVKFKAAVRAVLDFRHFPFDRHTLQVHLEDAERDVRSVEFIPDTLPNGRQPLAVSQDLDPQDWSIGPLSLTTGRHREPTTFGDPTQTADSEYSRAVLHIGIARKHSLRILITLLLGTFMSILVAFSAVLLPIQHSPPRYTLISSALFVCITNRLLVESRLPPGGALGLLDQLQLLTIVALILLTGVSLTLTNFAEKKIPPLRATQLSQRLGLGWVVGLGLMQTLLILLHRSGT